MPQEDYLKLTLENILNQLSEVKDMINDSTRANKEFENQIRDKISDLESRINVLETEKKLLSGIFSSGAVQKVLGWLLMAAALYLGTHLDLFLNLFK